MQLTTSSQNYRNINPQPTFKAIKRINCWNDFKPEKYIKDAQIVDAFLTNPAFKRFFELFDGTITIDRHGSRVIDYKAVPKILGYQISYCRATPRKGFLERLKSFFIPSKTQVSNRDFFSFNYFKVQGKHDKVLAYDEFKKDIEQTTFEDLMAKHLEAVVDKAKKSSNIDYSDIFAAERMKNS